MSSLNCDLRARTLTSSGAAERPVGDAGAAADRD
jgi:hypothetical protein